MMGGCAAVFCSNSDKKGKRMFNFPSSEKRRKIWGLRCPRDKWVAKKTAQLCEDHFNENQWEKNRKDGWLRLKLTAEPTRFRKSFDGPFLDSDKNFVPHNGDRCKNSLAEPKILPVFNEVISEVTNCTKCQIYENVIEDLKKKNEELKNELIQKNVFLKKLDGVFNNDQIAAMEKKKVNKWEPDTIIKGIKLRIGLGVHGYKYLLSTGYPAPAYSTITERLRGFQLQFGMFENILEPLSYKIGQMDDLDRFCMLSIDEMEINPRICLDKNKKILYGNATLGPKLKRSSAKLLVAMIRGLKSKWKQAIACHVTTGPVPSETLKYFIMQCVSFTEKAGLKMIALGSDMGNDNRKLWTALDIAVCKHGIRQNYFEVNGNKIFVVPDSCHLLKNMRSAVLTQTIILPENYVEENNLPTSVVNGKYIKVLWEAEVNQEFRSLHHLNHEDVYPDNFEKMNVGSAVRLMSLKTAVAIEKAVNDNVLPQDALTTSHFINLIDRWFTLVSSRQRKTSITSKNCEVKYDFLFSIISLFEDILIGKAWKPLNTGMILNSLSLIHIAQTLFLNKFSFILFSRLNQDALENMFSYIRRRAGKLPDAKQCLEALKSLSVSQYVSDLSQGSYSNDSDFYLLDFFKKYKSSPPPQVTFSDIKIAKKIDIHLDLIPKFSSLNTRLNDLNNNKDNNLAYILHIAGSTTCNILKTNTVCELCSKRLSTPTQLSNLNRYTNLLSQGGLRTPCEEVLKIILYCEDFYNVLKPFLMMTSYKVILHQIEDFIETEVPDCSICCYKKKIIEHFFTVRSYIYCQFLSTQNSLKRKCKTVYGSATAKKLK